MAYIEVSRSRQVLEFKVSKLLAAANEDGALSLSDSAGFQRPEFIVQEQVVSPDGTEIRAEDEFVQIHWAGDNLYCTKKGGSTAVKESIYWDARHSLSEMDLVGQDQENFSLVELLPLQTRMKKDQERKRRVASQFAERDQLTEKRNLITGEVLENNARLDRFKDFRNYKVMEKHEIKSRQLSEMRTH